MIQLRFYTLTSALLAGIYFIQLCEGFTIFEPKDSVCCNGNLSKRQFGNATHCCGNQIFDGVKFACCKEDDEHFRVVTLPIDLRQQYESEFYEYKCCGDSAYHEATHICCNNNPVEKMYRNTACCDGHPYDADRFVCCSNTLIPLGSKFPQGKNELCCNQQKFDSNKYICCEGKLHRKYGDSTACCGSESIIVGQEGCCGGVPYIDSFGIMGCCGNVTYDALAEICCGDVVWPDLYRTKACCGTKTYTAKTETCCNGQVIPKSGREGGSSCCSGSDPKSSICCGGVPVSLPPPGISNGFYQCCGTGVYNQLSQICCDGKPFLKKTASTRCCGSRTYETGDETCCGDTVLSSTSSIVRRGLKKCCRGKVVEVPHEMQLCC